MKIENRPITSIRPYGKNAKKHSEKQIKQIAESIVEFGFNQPVVVDKDGIIIVGHGRFAAAHLAGLTEIPVLQIDIDEEKAKAYRLADNKLNESDWDMELVISELKSLSIPMVDLTGFSRKLVINNNDKDDDVPNLPEKPKTLLGDLYELGDHKLFCGDSTLGESFLSLFKGIKADMVFTDPPYNVDYKGSGEKTSQGILNDKMSDATFRHFLIAAFNQIKENTKSGAGMYIFHDPSTQKIFYEALNINNLTIINQLIWNKPSAGLGMKDYRKKHEPFFYVGIQGQTPQFYGDRTNSTVLWRQDKLHSFRLSENGRATIKMGQSTETSRTRRSHNNLDNETHTSTRLRSPYTETCGAYYVRLTQQLKGRGYCYGPIPR